MIWLSTKKIAELEQTSERTVQCKIKEGGYEHTQAVNGKGRGGKVLKIALESLPQSVQNHYHAQQTGQQRQQAAQQTQKILSYTGAQRQAADRKAWIVTQYWQSGLSPNEFITDYNVNNPDCLENPMNIHKLMRWQGKYKKNKNVADLIDTRGEHRRGITSISDEAWEYFCSLYLTLQRLSVQRCWEFVLKKHPDTPGVSTYERKVRTIPEYVLIEFRQGQKTLADHMPTMLRSKFDIKPNDIIFSDHHLMDVFIRNSIGKVFRPWLTLFFDARSSKVMAYIVREAAPNSTVVKQCLKKSILAHGIPNEVYFDNGKDYKSKAFNMDYPLSIVNQLGIGNIYAIPYNAKAKAVERFFRTLEDRFNKLFPTYLGKDAKDRPESMRISNKKIAKIAPTMDEYLAELDTYIEEYNNTKSRGWDMDGKSPNQVYAENAHTSKRVVDENILNVLCGTFEERTVGKNGVRILNNYYYSEGLIPYYGKKVIVSYVPENIDKIIVFDTDMRIVCEAAAKVVTPYRSTTEDDYRKAQREKKAVRNYNKQYAPIGGLNIHSLIAASQLSEKQYEEYGEIDSVPYIGSTIRHNSRKLKEIAEANERDPKSIAITDTLLEYYNNTL